MSLYKGKYLIAIYDKKDNFIECSTSIQELRFTNRETVVTRISKNDLFKSRKYNIFLIDCLEKHDDIFAEEDKIFLNEENLESREENFEKIAKEFGKSVRTIKRYFYKGLIKIS